MPKQGSEKPIRFPVDRVRPVLPGSSKSSPDGSIGSITHFPVRGSVVSGREELEGIKEVRQRLEELFEGIKTGSIPEWKPNRQVPNTRD